MDALLLSADSAFSSGKCLMFGCGFCYDTGFDDYVVCRVARRAGLIAWDDWEWVSVLGTPSQPFFEGLEFEFEWEQYARAFDVVLSDLA